jgi:hypothetical protein
VGDVAARPLFEGRFWITDPEAGFFDAELFPSGSSTDPGIVPQPAFRGRGWVQVDGAGEALIFIGDNRSTGLTLIAR